MDTKPIAALGFLLVLAGSAIAYGPETRTHFGPTTVSVGPGSASFGPTGAGFDDIGCSHDGNANGKPDNAPGCLDDIDGTGCVATDNGFDCDGKDDVAIGSCRVSSATAVGGPGGVFLCGSDRDDDSILTDGDATGTSSDTHDDDFVLGNMNQVVSFCFARDRVTLGPADPNGADDDWDEFLVFVGHNLGPLGSVGMYTVALSASGAGVCPGTRSSHSVSNDWVA